MSRHWAHSTTKAGSKNQLKRVRNRILISNTPLRDALELPNNMLIGLGKVEQQQARTPHRRFLATLLNQFECIKGQIVEMPPVQIWILVFTSTFHDTRTNRWRSHLQQSWRICNGVRPNMEAISKNSGICCSIYWWTHRCRNQTDGRSSFSPDWTRASTSGRHL